MDTGSQAPPSKSVNFPHILKKRQSKLMEKAKKPKEIVVNVLEESKRLEYLNRKISKISGNKVLHHLSTFKKSWSPSGRQTNSFSCSTPYEALIKIPENIKERKSSISEALENYDLTKSTNRSKDTRPKPPLKKEFEEIDFKEMIWPDDSIIDNELYKILLDKTQAHQKFVVNNAFNKNLGNVRIKSRIGAFTSKYEEKHRRATADNSKRRQPPRLSTPWTYSSNHYTCIFNPELI